LSPETAENEPFGTERAHMRLQTSVNELVLLQQELVLEALNT
jgi:hypothetical protein